MFANRSSTEFRDDELKGVGFYIIHTVFMTANLYINKALFNAHPEVSALQFTFVRGVCSVLLSLLDGMGTL